MTARLVTPPPDGRTYRERVVSIGVYQVVPEGGGVGSAWHLWGQRERNRDRESVRAVGQAEPSGRDVDGNDWGMEIDQPTEPSGRGMDSNDWEMESDQGMGQRGISVAVGNVWDGRKEIWDGRKRSFSVRSRRSRVTENRRPRVIGNRRNHSRR